MTRLSRNTCMSGCGKGLEARLKVSAAEEKPRSGPGDMQASVLRLVRLVEPFLERPAGALVRKVDRGKRSFRGWRQDLPVNQGVVEARGGRAVSRGGEEDASRTRPVERSQAHGAGFARCVYVASGKLKVSQRPAGFADGDDFGVGRGVVGRLSTCR